MRDRNKRWFLAVVQWIRQHMDDAGQGSRRGEYLRAGDGVAFLEQIAITLGRTEYLGKIAWVVGDRARLETGEVVSVNDLVAVMTPEEIAERCAEVRSGWSEETRERRWQAFTWELRRSKKQSGVKYWDNTDADNLYRAMHDEPCGGGWRRSAHESEWNGD